MKPYYIHPKAVVEKGAILGKNTRVWAFAHVMKQAIVGKDCNLGDFSFVETGAILGNHVTVKNGVQIYEGVIAKDGVFIGPNAVFTNDLHPRSFLKRPKKTWLKKTIINEGATIGAGAVILCGNTIGEFAMIGAGAIVTHDVQPYALVIGTPAHFHSWICRCGKKLISKRSFFHCTECQLDYIKIGKRGLKPRNS